MYENFPYIRSVHVKDCFASKDFLIPVTRSEVGFSHLILTGRNGSGKSTILRELFGLVGTEPQKHSSSDLSKLETLEYESQFIDQIDWMNHWGEWTKLLFVRVHFPATRRPLFNSVEAPTPSMAASHLLGKSSAELGPEMIQFLVNKKVAQAFSQIANRKEEVEAATHFFELLEKDFRQLFADNSLRISFIENQYDFDFILGDGRKVKFNDLPDGFASSLYLLMDLKLRVDAIRVEAKDQFFDPPGIVFIDEPELHLHLELQYQVLALLTTLFPNIQFIVATHSPAVISSIKNATVFDLTTKQIAPSYTPGAAFSELMQTHFGLENEYGPVADAFLEKAKEILQMSDKVSATSKLKELLHENEDVLTPTLRLELESTLIYYQAKQNLEK
jgi:predicted ATP-binding protein involved in virulence